MILRIDDYPAGIRPVQPGQLDMFDRMIELLPMIHLGVVPVTWVLFQRYFDHRKVDVCQHGYNHGYSTKSHLLCDDLFNQRGTVGVFDEFEGMTYTEILTSISLGKSYLENEFDCSVDTFIPCCNMIDKRLAEILFRIGFTRILCENVVPSPIPIIKSGFYGKLEGLTEKHEVITLHLPWEWDTVREKGFDYWAELVKQKRDANFI